MKVIFDGDGIVNSTTPICTDFTLNLDSFRFGDIVISSDGSTLYGSSLKSEVTDTEPTFFSIDLARCNYTAISTVSGTKLQLAFGSDGNLYGQSTGTGEFFLIDPADGSTTSMGIPTGAQDGFTDIASGSLCVLEEETAWGGTLPFPGKNWATYISYDVNCCFGIPSSNDITIDVDNTEQGKRKDGTDVLANRSFPESIKIKYDNILSGESTGFFSLGFGGSIEFSFSCPVSDGDGNDLRIYETTGGTTYPLEQAKVFALSGGNWVYVGTVDNDASGLNRPGEIDLDGSGVYEATTFRIVDTTDEDLFDTRPNADALRRAICRSAERCLLRLR